MNAHVTVETPITERAFQWVEDVLSKTVPACKNIIRACKRHKRDLKLSWLKGGDFPYVFDMLRAEHMCAFVETMPHVKGAYAKVNAGLELLGWQAFTVASIGGWVHRDTGFRRFRVAYIEVPRKNGKSTLLAGIALYFLAVDEEPGAEVYSAASSTKQARIVFDTSKIMARRAGDRGEPLSNALGLKIEEHKILLRDDEAAVYQPVASQTKSHDGKSPHFCSADELHEHQKPDVWASMIEGMGARDQPLMMAITTAGVDTTGICFEQRRYLEAILKRTRDDEEYFGLIFEADDGDEPGDEKTWAKSNPSLGTAKTLAYMRGRWRAAQANARAMGEFLRKHLDIWTSTGAVALDLDKWRKGENPDLTVEDFKGRTVQIGVDLAIRDDFASVAATFEEDGRYTTKFWHFLPQAKVEQEGFEHYADWADQGRIYHTPGNSLDLEIVQSLVFQLCGEATPEEIEKWPFEGVEALDIEHVIYDPKYGAQMVSAWEGRGISCIELQSRAANFNEPFNRLIATVDDGKMITDGCPVAAWMAGNVVEKRVIGGDYIYPTKIMPDEKIDGIAALLNSIWPLGQVLEEESEETEGFINA